MPAASLVHDRLVAMLARGSAFEALKAIEDEGLTFTTEQELEHAIKRLEEGEP
jgi:hypothetical protein